MRNGPSIEAWLFMLLIVVSIIAVIVVGKVAVKIYRKFQPFEEETSEGFSISVSHNIHRDGFFKILIVGLLLTSPALYFLFLNI